MFVHHGKQISVSRPLSNNTVGTKLAFVMTAGLMVKTSPVYASEALYNAPWLMHWFWSIKPSSKSSADHLGVDLTVFNSKPLH
jgi:hypothetical protein